LQLIDINFTAALYAQDGFLVERFLPNLPFRQSHFQLLTLVIASDDTMKNTSRKENHIDHRNDFDTRFFLHCACAVSYF